MGREVRKVPASWEHPKDKNGNHIPLLGRSFSESLTKWEKGLEMWEKGFRESWNKANTWKEKQGEELQMPYEEWAGDKPIKEDYMPEWADNQATHLQMYENTTEGTPISPVMGTAEELAKWLADNNASAFAGFEANYEQWLSTIKRGSACSAVVQNGIITSGVAGM